MTLPYPSLKLGPLSEVQPSPSLSCCPSISTKQLRLSLICPYWILYRSRTIQYMVICVWRRSMKFLRVSHVIACISSPSVFTTKTRKTHIIWFKNQTKRNYFDAALKWVQEQGEGPPKMATATTNLIFTNVPCPFPPGWIKPHEGSGVFFWAQHIVGPSSKKWKIFVVLPDQPLQVKAHSNQHPREG